MKTRKAFKINEKTKGSISRWRDPSIEPRDSRILGIRRHEGISKGNPSEENDPKRSVGPALLCCLC